VAIFLRAVRRSYKTDSRECAYMRISNISLAEGSAMHVTSSERPHSLKVAQHKLPRSQVKRLAIFMLLRRLVLEALLLLACSS